MKSIKLKLSLFTVLLCCIVLGSCDVQDYDIQVPERVFGRLDILNKDLTFEDKGVGNLSFEYQVTGTREQVKLETKIANNRYHSALSYRSEELGWIDASVLDIDLQEVIDKKNMNIIIEKHAKTLKKKFDVKTVNRIADILEGLPELLYNELGRKEYYDESTLSIFYHLAAFNTTRRSYEKQWSGDCQCEVNPNYLIDKSPFFCAEDVMMTADLAYDLIKEKSEIKKTEGYQFNPETLLKYLNNESGQLVSASIIDKLLRDELDSFWRKSSIKTRMQIIGTNFTLSMLSRVTTRSEWDAPGDPNCWLYGATSGSDCGCCDNYDLPCMYCHAICWAHDYACINCGWSWACGSNCVPGC